jgi:hypothetical protein
LVPEKLGVLESYLGLTVRSRKETPAGDITCHYALGMEPGKFLNLSFLEAAESEAFWVSAADWSAGNFIKRFDHERESDLALSLEPSDSRWNGGKGGSIRLT